MRNLEKRRGPKAFVMMSATFSVPRMSCSFEVLVLRDGLADPFEPDVDVLRTTVVHLILRELYACLVVFVDCRWMNLRMAHVLEYLT